MVTLELTVEEAKWCEKVCNAYLRALYREIDTMRTLNPYAETPKQDRAVELTSELLEKLECARRAA